MQQKTIQEQIFIEEQRKRSYIYRLLQIKLHNINVIKGMLKQGINIADYPDIYHEYELLIAEFGPTVFELEDGSNLTKEEANLNHE